MARERGKIYCQDLSLEDEWTTTDGSRPTPFPICDKFTAAREQVINIATETTLRQLASMFQPLLADEWKLCY